MSIIHTSCVCHRPGSLVTPLHWERGEMEFSTFGIGVPKLEKAADVEGQYRKNGTAISVSDLRIVTVNNNYVPRGIDNLGFDGIADIAEPSPGGADFGIDIEKPAAHANDEKRSAGTENDLQARLWGSIDDKTKLLAKETKKYEQFLKNAVRVVILLVYLAYLIYACVRHPREAAPILGATIAGALSFAYIRVRDNFGSQLWERHRKPVVGHLEYIWDCTKWLVFIVIIFTLVVVLFFLVRDNPKQLVSGLGLLVFIFITYIFSKHPRHVKWRPVIWGLALQFIFGLLILRTKFGFATFNWFGEVIRTALGFSDKGAEFVFGEDPCPVQFFAFRVLPVVLYFSSAIAVLYHLGVMQVVVSKIAWLMQYTMKTSASESLNAAGNIFIGQTEAPLLIRPLLNDMTKSELHAVMTGGFATIAGSVLGAYVAFGISASHLLSASVMSAPAALAISKLFYPETEESSTRTVDQINLPKSGHRNMVEAASYGAATAVPLVLNIAANLIGFLALLALFDGILGYLGGLVDVLQLSFMFICGYAFMPVAWLMGVDPKDCQLVAELIGAKTFVNEFYAYDQLSELIQNRLNGIEPYLSIRSEVIATYALCGFANIGSVGIQLGGLTSMAPDRKGDLAKVSLRALIAGSIACFMTASIAGILYDETTYDGGAISMMSTCDAPAMNATTLATTPDWMPTSGSMSSPEDVISTSNFMFRSDVMSSSDMMSTSGPMSSSGVMSSSDVMSTVADIITSAMSSTTTVPVHIPDHVPDHVPATAPPAHVPDHVPATAPSAHVPDHVPATAPPAHVPDHVPATAPPAHVPDHVPATAPPAPAHG